MGDRYHYRHRDDQEEDHQKEDRIHREDQGEAEEEGGGATEE